MKTFLTFILCLLIAPSITLAQTADVDPQGSSSCVSLSNNLRYRTTDAQASGDVSVLQDFLQANGYLKASPSGYFGLLTAQGVKSFQSINGISPTGYVGPLTRAKIQTVSCAGTSVNIPTNSASNNQNGTTAASGCASGAIFSSTTGARCQNTSTATQTLDSKVTTTKPYITILSPNGGENYNIGSQVPIKFITNLTDQQTTGMVFQLYKKTTDSFGKMYVQDIATNWVGGSPYNWTILNSLTSGNYYIYVAAQGLRNVSAGDVLDFSDNYFTINSQATNQPPTNPTTPQNTSATQPATSATNSTQPYFYISGMSPDATGAIAIVGKPYPGSVGFSTTPEVIRSNQISFDVQGLPPGLTMDKYVYQIDLSNFGLIRFKGTPTQAGTFTVTVTFTYGSNYTTTRTFYLIVNPAGTVTTGTPQYTEVPSAPYTPPVPVPAIVSSAPTQTTTPISCTPSNNSSTPVSTTNSVGTVTVTSPNGGQCLTKGSPATITWTSSSNIDKVTIFYISSLGTIGTIASNIPNTGSYIWNINVGNTINTQYKIEVLGYQTGLGSVSDTSDSFVTIN